jgi:hypothetical protein
MLVKTYKDGQHTGLQIGEANARRYFNRRARSIELRLDDLRIQCTLADDFWQDCPRIHDPRLSEWLEFKAGRRSGREAMQFSLVPSGPQVFVLRPPTEGCYDAFGAEVLRARAVKAQRVAPQSETHRMQEPCVA